MISIPSTFKISLRALRVNKMRSALTMLGIIIGVAAVITMLAVANGATEKISEQISSIGSNLIMITPGSKTSSGLRLGSGAVSTLTRDDALAIERECPQVMDVAPYRVGVAQVAYGNQNWATGIYGTTSSALRIRDWQLVAGRNFTDQDIRNYTKTCILGQTVVKNLFAGADPIGKTIRIKKVPFMVIGVLDIKGQSIMGQQDQDDTIYVPITTAEKKLFGAAIPGVVHTIMVKTKSIDDLGPAEQQITQLLVQRHRIGPKQENDFTVRNLTQMMETMQTVMRFMSILLGAIASISLLVGGIGIMNIMLVSVTERTREIGIRMAIGAKTWDIRLQFIIEAVTLSLIGGLFGIILGFGLSRLIAVFAGWTPIVSFQSILLAVSFSALIGIFFGFYPAYKASLLNPIDALRYE
jgi:putative ABC transport system permease protein